MVNEIKAHVITLLLCCSGFFVAVLSRVALLPILPLMVDEFHLTNEQVGIIETGFWFFYGIAMFPFGILSDKVSRKMMIVGGILCQSVAVILMGSSHSFEQVLVFRALTAIAQATFYPSAASLLSDLFRPEKRGLVLGCLLSGGYLGNFLGQIFASVISALIGWRISFYACFMIGLTFALFFWIFAREPSRIGKVTDSEKSKIVDIALLREISVITMIFALMRIFGNGFQTFLPMYLFRIRELNLIEAAFFASAYSSIAFFSSFVGGILSDAFGRIKIIVICLFFTSFLTFIFIKLSCLGSVLFMILASIGFFTSMIMPALQAHLTDSVSLNRGAAFGFFESVGQSCGSIGPFLTGYISDSAGLEQAYLLLGAIPCVGMVVAYKIVLKRN